MSSNHLNTISNRIYTSSFISCVFSLSAVCSIQFGSTKKKVHASLGGASAPPCQINALENPRFFPSRGLIAQRWWWSPRTEICVLLDGLMWFVWFDWDKKRYKKWWELHKNIWLGCITQNIGGKILVSKKGTAHGWFDFQVIESNQQKISPTRTCAARWWAPRSYYE